MTIPLALRRCDRPLCDRRHYRRGLCEPHYWLDRAERRRRGEFDQLDTADVQRHLRLLRHRGWSWAALERPAGVSSTRLIALHAGEVPTMQRRQIDRILAIQPVWQRSRLSVPAAGTARRLAALSWQGWTYRICAAELGMSLSMLNHIRGQDTITAATAAPIAEFYREHIELPGPNQRSAKRSRTMGALPAGVWDDDTIDDPDAQPDLGALRLGQSRFIDLDEVVERRRRGDGFDEIAAALGFTANSVRDAWNRAQRGRGAA